MPETSARAAFLDLVGRPDPQIDLARGALLIAKEEYPALDVEAYRRRLDELAEAARPRVAASGDNPFAVIDGLNSSLFQEQGFRGNEEEYFDPRNSFLNDVIDRRRGIPISLSVVYIEVASRLGFPIDGVGFPGHFLVRHSAADREILIDPFHRGEILLPEDCRGRLRAAYGRDVPLDPRFLQSVGRRQILARMLHNLRAIYQRGDDPARLLAVLDRLVALEPGEPELLRDRGLAHVKLSHFGRAVGDLEGYLSERPAASDARAVRDQIKAIRRLTALLS